MLNRLDYSALTALSAVLQTGSFENAAHRLHVTPSAISQRIKSLEEQIGAILVQRGAPCTATDIGRRLARHVENVGLLEAELRKDIGLPEGIAGGTAARAPVRLALNADSLATWFCGAMTACSDLLFQLEIDDQDHSANWLKRGDVSGAVSAHSTPIAGFDCHALGAQRYYATASPAFVARYFPDGITKESLLTAPSLVFDEKDRLQNNWIKSMTGQDLPVPSHRMPSTHGFVEAAILGLGWGINPEALLQEHLRSGALVRLSDVPIDIALFWHISRLNAPALAPITAAVKAAAQDALIQSGAQT